MKLLENRLYIIINVFRAQHAMGTSTKWLNHRSPHRGLTKFLTKTWQFFFLICLFFRDTRGEVSWSCQWKYKDFIIFVVWSPLVKRNLLTTFYGLYFNHHITQLHVSNSWGTSIHSFQLLLYTPVLLTFCRYSSCYIQFKSKEINYSFFSELIILALAGIWTRTSPVASRRANH